MDESALIAAAQKGEAAAFNQLVRAYQQRVYHTAYRMIGDTDAAADATQDAFLSAFKHLREFRGGSFKAWLLRIVTNACYDQLRARQRRPTASLDALLADADNPAPGLERAISESPQASAERAELSAMIEKGLHTLAPDQRITLILVDIQGLDYQEAAEATNTNLGTVKSRLSRARAQMREFLLAQEELLPTPYRLKSETSQGVRSTHLSTPRER
jgi:RNA polymerase sigma-70 factor (ECF subfamily)